MVFKNKCRGPQQSNAGRSCGLCHGSGILAVLIAVLLLCLPAAPAAPSLIVQVNHASSSPPRQQQERALQRTTIPEAELLQDWEAAHSAAITSNSEDAAPLDLNTTCAELNAHLNNASAPMECECTRFDEDGISTNCSYTTEHCTPDGNYCFTGFIKTAFNENHEQVVTLTCTNATKVGNSTVLSMPQDACIQVYPNGAGNFDPYSNCLATLNDFVCESCGRCPSIEGGVALECCHIQDDTIMPCTSFTNSHGVMFIQFDREAPPDQEPGQCTLPPPPPPPPPGGSEATSGAVKHDANYAATLLLSSTSVALLLALLLSYALQN